MDYLSNLITNMEVIASWIDEDSIENLTKSLNDQPKPLLEPMKKMIASATSYRDATERAIDKISEKLQDFSDIITSDMDATNYAESKLDEFKKKSKRAKGCARIDEAEIQLKKFSSEVDDYMQNFKDEIAPGLETITETLANMRTNYNTKNTDNVDIATATKEIEEFIAQLDSEAAAIDGRVEKKIDALGSFIKAKATESEKYMKDDILGFFMDLV